MRFETELIFFRKLLSQLHLNIHLIRESDDINTAIDLGLRKFLHLEEEYENIFHGSLKKLQPNVIYGISDDFFCKYIAFLLPEDSALENTYVVIGPYTDESFSDEDLARAAEIHQISPMLMDEFTNYYSTVTHISDENYLSVILNAFGETIWGSADKFSVRNIFRSFSSHQIDTITKILTLSGGTQKDISAKMQLLENRYAAENRFMQHIAQGNYHKAEAALEGFQADSSRNLKNSCIVLNTLLRKAAEQGTVHPIHIERLSADFTNRIEGITSGEAGKQLMRDMIRRYGVLVKNYSMEGYSMLVRKVVTRIDSDLTADQTLNTHAGILNVSPSYLSTLFRKEIGVTLTEYVNRKRVEHGIYLLNTTNLQVQTIAQHCGISDINYFTRVFKKYIGKTPKEYRNSIG